MLGKLKVTQLCCGRLETQANHTDKLFRIYMGKYSMEVFYTICLRNDPISPHLNSYCHEDGHLFKTFSSTTLSAYPKTRTIPF